MISSFVDKKTANTINKKALNRGVQGPLPDHAEKHIIEILNLGGVAYTNIHFGNERFPRVRHKTKPYLNLSLPLLPYYPALLV